MLRPSPGSKKTPALRGYHDFEDDEDVPFDAVLADVLAGTSGPRPARLANCIGYVGHGNCTRRAERIRVLKPASQRPEAGNMWGLYGHTYGVNIAAIGGRWREDVTSSILRRLIKIYLPQ